MSCFEELDFRCRLEMFICWKQTHKSHNVCWSLKHQSLSTLSHDLSLVTDKERRGRVKIRNRTKWFRYKERRLSEWAQKTSRRSHTNHVYRICGNQLYFKDYEFHTSSVNSCNPFCFNSPQLRNVGLPYSCLGWTYSVKWASAFQTMKYNLCLLSSK